MKKIILLILAALPILALCSCAAVGSQAVLKVNIKENGAYYSEAFEVKKSTVSFGSNMDCAIEIVNTEDESDSVTIGYLTPGVIEKVKLKPGKKYKIKSDRSDTDGLEITVKGISK